MKLSSNFLKMKIFSIVFGLVLIVCALKSVQTDIKLCIEDTSPVNISAKASLQTKDADRNLEVANISVDLVEVLVNVIQLIVESEILNALSSLLGPIGSVFGIVRGIMGLFNNEPDIERLFAQQNEFLRQSFMDMSNQLERLSMQMQEGEVRIIATVQYQGVLEIISQIDGFLDRIPILLRSYSYNNERLLEQIDEQLRLYGNLDDDLTNLVFVESPATSQQSTLLDSVISLCTPEMQSCSSISSTNQMIYNFYEHIMVSVGKGAYFQKKMYQIKEVLMNGIYTDKNYFAFQEKTLIE